MSNQIMSQCWPLQMPPTAKAVLISLAENANDQGACWPSIPTIATRTCFSERAVQGAIKWLEQVGLLKANRSNGRHTSYVVTPESYAQPPQEIHPRSKSAPAGDSPTPAGDASVPPQMPRQPPQEVPSNHQEPSLEPSKNRKAEKFDPMPDLLEAGVDQQTANDWLKHRKTKRAEVTKTVLNQHAKQAALAGISLTDALSMSCSRGWIGFEAKFIQGRQTVGSGGYESAKDKSRREASEKLTGRTSNDNRIIDVN